MGKKHQADTKPISSYFFLIPKVPEVFENCKLSLEEGPNNEPGDLCISTFCFECYSPI